MKLVSSLYYYGCISRKLAPYLCIEHFRCEALQTNIICFDLKPMQKIQIKDGSASIVGFFSILVSTQFEFIQMDAIGGMVMTLSIYFLYLMSH